MKVGFDFPNEQFILVHTEGPRLTRILGLVKNRVTQHLC